MERDDVIEYSLDAHHSEEAGKKIRKKIYFVTIVLSVITAVEVLMGAFLSQTEGLQGLIKFSFIILTIVKAAYIVMVFMHLGDERKSLRWVILLPYALFILYLLFVLLTDATVLHHFKNSIEWW
jgi:cytochrome c oxidase subunit 4